MPKALRSPAHMLLVARLKQVRHDAGLRQAQVATLLGVPQSYLAKVEGGERRLDVIEFISLVRALGADPVDLLIEIDRMVADGAPKA